MERKLIAVAVSSALALPMAAQAVEVSPYGQINRAIISVDGTGEATDGDLQHTDSAASGSRWGLTGSEDLENGMTAGFKLEYGLGGGDPRFAHVNLSTNGGKLTLGHTSTATDGMAHADLSGGPSFLGGATPWCAYAGSGPACPTNDGGRTDVLRYDTPAIGPAAISMSVGNDDYWDVMLKISGSMGDAGYDLRIGHIGERDHMVADPDSPAMAAVPAEDGVTYSHTRSIDGADLLMVLQDENMPEPDPDNVGEFVANDFWDSNGMPLDTAVNNDTEVQAAIAAHVASDDEVVEIRQDGIDADVNTSTYIKTTTHTTEGDEGQVAMAQGMEEEKRGDITTASAAFSFGQGTSVALVWSQDNAADNQYQYVKLDHSYGDGSVAVYYKNAETGKSEGDYWGVAVGHNVAPGLTAYAGFRQLSHDKEDVDLLVAGLRVSFN